MPVYENFRSVLRENSRTYLWANVVGYGTLIATMIATPLVPGMRDAGLRAVEAFVSAPVLSLVTDAYTDGSVVTAALLTFLANLLFAALLTTTLPSLVIPFFGVAATIWRAVFVAVPFSPTSPEDWTTILVFLPVLALEFQAYVLAMLGSVALWQSTFGYRRRGLRSAWAGYRAGVRDTVSLYPAVVLALLGIALIEATTSSLVN